MAIEKWKNQSIVPQGLTVREIPRKVTASDILRQSEPLQVHVHQIMPDELRLIIFGGFVAMLVWFMLTVYVVSFSKPQVIIIEGSTERVSR